MHPLNFFMDVFRIFITSLRKSSHIVRTRLIRGFRATQRNRVKPLFGRRAQRSEAAPPAMKPWLRVEVTLPNRFGGFADQRLGLANLFFGTNVVAASLVSRL